MDQYWEQAVSALNNEIEAGMLRRYYRRFGHEAMLLAAHAALLPALTPDLVYKLWFNFRENKADDPQQPLSMSVSDLLLSPLCREVGRGLFEMLPAVREALLDVLRAHPQYGAAYLQKLAQFAYFYWRDNPAPMPSPAYSEALRWTADMYLHPNAVAKELIELLQQAQPNPARLQRMMEAAGMRQRLLERDNSRKAGKDPLGVALNLVQGMLNYQSGHQAIGIQQMQHVAPYLRDKSEEKGIQVRLSEDILKAIQTPDIEIEFETKVSYEKIIIITDKDVDKERVFRGFLGGDIPEVTYPITIFDKQFKREDPSGKQLLEINYQVWQFDEENIPPVLDSMLITKNAIYVVAINYVDIETLLGKMLGRTAFDYENGEEALFQQIADKVNRIIYQAGSFPGSLHLVILAEGAVPPDTISAIKSRIKDIRRIFVFDNKKQDDIPALLSPGIRSTRPPLLSYPNADRLVNYLYTGPWQYIPYSEFETLFERYGISEGRHEILQYCIEAGLLTAGQYWRDKEDFILGVTVTGIYNFLTLVTSMFVEYQPRSEPGMGVDQFESAIGRREIPGDTEKMIRLLESYAILSWPGEKERIFVPSRLMNTPLSPQFDRVSSNTRYVRWKLPALAPACFDVLQCRLNSLGYDVQNGHKTMAVLIGGQFIAEIYIEDGAIVLRTPSEVQNVFDELINRIPSLLLRSFPNIIYEVTRLDIPAHATPRMAPITGGTFTMGDVMGDKENNAELPLHEVTLDNYELGAYAVTFAEYDAFCEATGREKPGDEGWGRDDRPVINVDLYDAIEYCNWLSEIWGLPQVYEIDKTKKDPNSKSTTDGKKWLVSIRSETWQGGGYRLPTEAEWEYAARAVDGKAGGKVRFGNGKYVADPMEINFDGSNKMPYSVVGVDRGKTTPVGNFSPNSLGLFDMSGNVWEWCWDWYGDYPSSPQTDPKGPNSGSGRVVRGGSWDLSPFVARCAFRDDLTPVSRSSSLGFRLARAAR